MTSLHSVIPLTFYLEECGNYYFIKHYSEDISLSRRSNVSRLMRTCKGQVLLNNFIGARMGQSISAQPLCKRSQV